MFEVELKVKVIDHEKLLSFLKKEGFSLEEVSLEDIYFEHPCRDLVKNEEEVRVRFDKIHNIIYLTYKSPLRKGNRLFREELEVRVNNLELISILKKLGFKEKLRKLKRGWRAKKKEFKLDLVEVTGILDNTYVNLGYYLEVEILTSETNNVNEAKDKILDLVDRIPYIGSIENKFYTELILEKAKK